MADELEQWDAAVGGLLAGRAPRTGPGADPTEQWLASAARPTAPPAVLARVDRSVLRAVPAGQHERRTDRPPRTLAVVALALCAAFVFQGVGNLVAGEWISENIGEPYGPHAFWEGGVAMIALGVCAAGGAISRRWSAASVLTCTPLAVAFGLHGTAEIGVFAAGVALHLTEGVLGVLLAVVWWRTSRDGRGTRREEGA